ncbi:MAG: alpha-galactosidase [Capsulimonadaceae bacterium]|nr:alpha-galactosidase [Capsulimonadaceae bacterium]
MSIQYENNRFTLENPYFSRTLQVDGDGLRTVSIVHKANNREFVRRPDALEFQVTLNGRLVESYSKAQYHILDGNLTSAEKHLTFEGHVISAGASGSEILELRFLVAEQKTRIRVFYEVYPDLPGASKWLVFDCLGGELHISKVFFEILNACAGQFANAEFYLRQGTIRAAANFASNDDDIVQVHSHDLDKGLFIANAAPGPLRYFMAYPHWPTGISCGYSMSAPDFNRFITQGQSFTTDKAYLLLYAGAQDDPVVRNQMRELIRRDLPACPDHGGVMYCTWFPFLKNINEPLILDLVDRAADLGFHTFVVDDGWFAGNDSWQVDAGKFPHGLEVIARRIRQRHMKFGLWYNIGNDYGAIGTRPQDNAMDHHGQPKVWGFSGELTTRCLASKHRDFLVSKLTQLAKRYSVDYFKLDFSSIVGPYGFIAMGCSAKRHDYHRDASDSVNRQYDAMYQFRQDVKKQFPNLIIDFSFEAFGTERPGIAALRYSELHHASNLNTNKPEYLTALKIRNTIYSYCTMLPPERILCGLPCLQNTHDLEHLLTAFVGAPLVAGDLRKITDDDAKTLTKITRTLNELIERGPLTEFHKLRGDSYIAPDDWDGFVRYTRPRMPHDTSEDQNKLELRGIVCLFRNQSTNASLILRVPGLPPNITFRFTDALTNACLGAFTGDDLHAGVAVNWLDEHDCRAVVFDEAIAQAQIKNTDPK